MSKCPNRLAASRRQRLSELYDDTTFLILCEGQTEEDYITMLRRKLHISKEAVIVIQTGDHNLQTLLHDAETNIHTADEIWVVCDSELNNPQEGEILGLLTNAKQAGVHVALQCPAIEMWLDLHLEEQPPNIDSTPKQALLHLRNKMPTYEKRLQNLSAADKEQLLSTFEHAVTLHGQMQTRACERTARLATYGAAEGEGMSGLIRALNHKAMPDNQLDLPEP